MAPSGDDIGGTPGEGRWWRTKDGGFAGALLIRRPDTHHGT